jgi:hypothetical protein
MSGAALTITKEQDLGLTSLYVAYLQLIAESAG